MKEVVVPTSMNPSIVAPVPAAAEVVSPSASNVDAIRTARVRHFQATGTSSSPSKLPVPTKMVEPYRAPTRRVPSTHHLSQDIECIDLTDD